MRGGGGSENKGEVSCRPGGGCTGAGVWWVIQGDIGCWRGGGNDCNLGGRGGNCVLRLTGGCCTEIPEAKSAGVLGCTLVPGGAVLAELDREGAGIGTIFTAIDLVTCSCRAVNWCLSDESSVRTCSRHGE